MPANISPYLLLLILLILILILLPAFSSRACACACAYIVYVCIYLYKKIPPPPYMREVVDYPPAPTPSFSLSFSFSTLPPLLRFARTVISYLYLSPPTTLHASIVQTDDENYLRFSANAINQKRRSASPPGPLDRQGYLSPPRRSVSLLWLSTRLDSAD